MASAVNLSIRLLEDIYGTIIICFSYAAGYGGLSYDSSSIPGYGAAPQECGSHSP